MTDAEFLVKEAWDALGYWAERSNNATPGRWRNFAAARYELWCQRYQAAVAHRQLVIEKQAEQVFADWLARATA